MNILIADDHEVMRDGIEAVIGNESIVDRIFNAETGKEALEKCKNKGNIDAIILDINMPDMDGIVAAKTIKERFPDIDIIALSMRNDEESIRNMLQAGASAYVLKDAGKRDLVQALHNVKDNKPFYSQEVTFKIMKHFADSNSQKNRQSTTDLTDREIEILQLISDELTNQEIADKLYISKRTVDTHRTNLLNKTNSKNTAGLVRYALQNGLV